jgi:predicted metal-dependent phosphoesterase TrpH
LDEGLKAETHCHTTSSDGRHSPDQVILEASKKDLDFIAITDHDTFRGAILAQRAAKLRGLEKPVVIPGNEVRTTRGDVLVLCEKPLSKTKKDPWELRDLVEENNCVMIAAHPYSFIEPAVGDFVKEAPELFDAIEVWNATNLPFLNSKAAKVARQLGKPGTAGSDAHVKEEVGSAYTLVYIDEASVEGFLEAVRKGNIKPVKGLPSIVAVLSHLAWGIKRRI